MQEQSNYYAAYIASIHLTAMRFCMLVIAKSSGQAAGIAEVRNQIIANARGIDYALRLWQVLHAVITGALEEMQILLGDMTDKVMKAIEQHMQNFFVQALQLDARTLKLEAR